MFQFISSKIKDTDDVDGEFPEETNASDISSLETSTITSPIGCVFKTMVKLPNPSHIQRKQC